MEIKFTNNNSIVKKSTPTKTQYILSLGTIFYNNRFVKINNLVIPIFNQDFFSLPSDKGKYAVVNVYYQLNSAQFIFDKIAIYDSYVLKASAQAKIDLIPVGQFVLKQESKSYIVDHVNEFSQMSTFSISDNLVQGETGVIGPRGETGSNGDTGPRGSTGQKGYIGATGSDGITGVGAGGQTGIQGTTGYYPDLSLQLYLKYKANSTKLTDYSIYERDVIWGISGGGSYFEHKEGIVDYSHKTTYNGGYSSYKRNIFLPFGESGAIYYPFGIGASITGAQGYTGGTISAWVKAEQAPIPDFTVETIDSINYKFRFKDNSLFSPDIWSWDFGDDHTSNVQNAIHEYNTAGDYMVKLTASNASGSNYIYKLITVTSAGIWDTILEF